MIDEVSGEKAYFLQKCNYTGKMVAAKNVKASKWITKTRRLVISKRAWSNLKYRKMYKNNKGIC